MRPASPPPFPPRMQGGGGPTRAQEPQRLRADYSAAANPAALPQAAASSLATVLDST